MANHFPTWTPFEEDDACATDDFYDPFEGRKSKKNDNFFYENPFANSFPQDDNSRWCRFPLLCYSGQSRPQPKKINRWAYDDNIPYSQKNFNICTSLLYNHPSKLPYSSFPSFDTIDEDIDTDVTPCLPIPPLLCDKKVNSKDTVKPLVTVEEQKLHAVDDEIEIEQNDAIDDVMRSVEERALRRVNSWLHISGLLDEFFVDMRSLPQNKYSWDCGSFSSRRSEEGIEIGFNGYALDGDTGRTDRKIKEFNATIVREINNLDVDIQLAESKIKSESDFTNREEFSDILRSGVHAQTNIAKVLTEVDFFNTIPETCDRLKIELDMILDDWNGVKKIVVDHVEMQSFLVELTLQWMKRQDFVDAEAFMHGKVTAVKELGNVLRSKLLQSVGVIFGDGDGVNLKLVVDAIQLYEDEVDKLTSETHCTQGGQTKLTMVRDLKIIAIQQILKDCEIRSHGVFQSYQEEAAEYANSTTAGQMSFEAILDACQNTTESIRAIQKNLISVFPNTWEIFSNCAAVMGSVCSQYILQEIGGEEGNHLTLLLPNQLLKLMSWIENYRLACNFSFRIDLTRFGKPIFISSEELRAYDRVKNPQESLAKVLAVLWDVHRLVEDQFMLETQFQTNTWLDNIFESDHSKNQTKEGLLQTSLPEDLWTLAQVQLTTIREHLVSESESFFHTVCIIFRCIQTKCRDRWRFYHQDVETCCAAANDAFRMIYLAELQLKSIKNGDGIRKEHCENIEFVIDQLTSQLLKDAVVSATAVHSYIFEPLDEVLLDHMFETEWEELTYNDMAVTITHTIDDYLKDMEKWLEESLLRKTLDALVRATIIFYLKHLLRKSIRRHKHTFKNIDRALQRMSGDIIILEEYFQLWSKKTPPLERILSREFQFLHTVLELMRIGYGLSLDHDPTHFFAFFQIRIGSFESTKFLCCQLWHLLSAEASRTMGMLFDASRKRLLSIDAPSEAGLDPTLQIENMIQEWKDKIKKRSTIKTAAKNATKQIVNKAGKIGKKAVRAIY